MAAKDAHSSRARVGRGATWPTALGWSISGRCERRPIVATADARFRVLLDGAYSSWKIARQTAYQSSHPRTFRTMAAKDAHDSPAKSGRAASGQAPAWNSPLSLRIRADG